MRREHRDGGGEVLGCLADFAGQEAELPAGGGKAGGDLPAPRGLKRRGEPARG
ncbi:hypothetical protein [Streptomyces sp. CNQ-509]|uniref:hypothetical protein n=1 Tax=Streptomyces sp. CNQ-509 TaxID=444103 RepID=UPI0013DE1A15|nr:hypothetical protein [Streptomyces sp. CNQ-509]